MFICKHRKPGKGQNSAWAQTLSVWRNEQRPTSRLLLLPVSSFSNFFSCPETLNKGNLRSLELLTFHLACLSSVSLYGILRFPSSPSILGQSLRQRTCWKCRIAYLPKQSQHYIQAWDALPWAILHLLPGQLSAFCKYSFNHVTAFSKPSVTSHGLWNQVLHMFHHAF